MTEIPDEPWSRVSADFCVPFPTGEYLSVVIDDYSRYPVVEILRSTSARSVIPLFDKIFSLFGIPEELKTDNGQPFQSFEFRQFAEQLGFKHHRITPLWPKANGKAERFMRILGKAIRTTHIESKNWKQEMFTLLRNYRATPHSTTNLSPAESLLKRKMRTKLPQEELEEIQIPNTPTIIESDKGPLPYARIRPIRAAKPPEYLKDYILT